MIVDKNLEFFAHPLHPSRPRLDALFLSHQSRSTKMPTHVRTPPAPFSRFPSPRATSRASRRVVSPFPANAAREGMSISPRAADADVDSATTATTTTRIIRRRARTPRDARVLGARSSASARRDDARVAASATRARRVRSRDFRVSLVRARKTNDSPPLRASLSPRDAGS